MVIPAEKAAQLRPDEVLLLYKTMFEEGIEVANRLSVGASVGAVETAIVGVAVAEAVAEGVLMTMAEAGVVAVGGLAAPLVAAGVGVVAATAAVVALRSIWQPRTRLPMQPDVGVLVGAGENSVSDAVAALTIS